MNLTNPISLLNATHNDNGIHRAGEAAGKMNFANGASTLNATLNGSVRRIRTPHPHDVLSGRGGGINGHA